MSPTDGQVDSSVPGFGALRKGAAARQRAQASRRAWPSCMRGRLRWGAVARVCAVARNLSCRASALAGVSFTATQPTRSSRSCSAPAVSGTSHRSSAFMPPERSCGCAGCAGAEPPQLRGGCGGPALEDVVAQVGSAALCAVEDQSGLVATEVCGLGDGWHGGGVTCALQGAERSAARRPCRSAAAR